MNDPSSSDKQNRSWWRLPLLLALVLAAVFMLRDRGVREESPASENQAPPASVSPSGQTVSLTIDFGETNKTEYEPIAWREGMTILDVMREAQNPKLPLKIVGSGDSTFLVAIGDIQNEGTAERNWMYSVNGKVGDRSFAVYELQPNDQVLWIFGTQ